MPNKAPLVSCIIPTYNYAHFVTQAVESALAQDYPAQSLEIIVVDDGSTDNTQEVLRPYLDRIRYIYKPNGGVVSAVNRGLQEARGEFIALLSADDLWPADRVRPDVEYLLQHPEVGLIYGDMEIINDHGERLHQSFRQLYGRPNYRGRLFGLLLRHCFVSGGAMLFRGSMKELFYPIPATMPCEDWWIALQIARVSKIESTDRIVYRYRFHGGNQNLGAEGERFANLLRGEVPLRRHFLSTVAVGEASPEELMHGFFALESSVLKVARDLDLFLSEIVPVTDDERTRSQAALAQAAALQSEGRAVDALFPLVNALTVDPWNRQARVMLEKCFRQAGVNAPFLPLDQNPFALTAGDPALENHWRILSNMSEDALTVEARKREGHRRILDTRAMSQRLTAREPHDGLHVVYVMNHVSVTGGAKVIFEHANRLSDMGIKVTIVSHYPRPNWYPVRCTYVQFPFHVELAQAIPDCDVIVATVWDQVQSCVETGIAPVVYFEQGDSHLFEKVSPDLKARISQQVNSAAFVITVSHQAARVIRGEFGRESLVFSNAVDTDVFHPHRSGARQNRPYLMIMGSDRVPFKDTATVLNAYELVREQGYDLDLVWVTPEELVNPVGRVVVRPDQHELREIYQGAVAFVSGSRYESFSLPPLEAMACGCPVVSTANVGVLEYARDGQNCLLAEIGDAHGLARQITRLLTEPGLRESLIKNGIETAGQFDWSRTVNSLERFYRYVSTLCPVPTSSVGDWEICISSDRFLGPEEHEVFLRTLQHTAADEVLVPAVDEAFEGHFVARWETGARRKGAQQGLAKHLFAPVVGHVEQVAHRQAIDRFRAGQYEAALELFKGNYKHAARVDEKLVYLRWIVLCLIELSRDTEAINLLRMGLRLAPDNTDLIYLYGIILSLTGHPEWLDAVQARVALLGDSAFLPEFFFGVKELARTRIGSFGLV